MPFYKSYIILSIALAFNVHAANNTTLGNNAYSIAEHSITIGDNATNTGAAHSDIVIGTNSHNGVVGRYIEGENIVTKPFDRNTGNIIIGSGSSSIETLNTIIGNKITGVHGENTLVGSASESSVYDATSLGYGNKVETEGGIALGNGAKADRKAGRYGYNAATGNYYSADDIINDSNNSKFGNEKLTEATTRQQQALNELTNKRTNYAEAFSEYKKQALNISSNIFKSQKEYEDALNSYKKASIEFAKAKKEYDSARNKVTKTSSILTNAGQGRVSTTGALSIADDNNLRQLTGLAAGTANTDAVNVKQLRDYATATKTSMKATNDRLTTAESTLTEHDTTIRRLTATEKEHETGIKANSDAIGNLKKIHASGMLNINNRINKMDKKLERGLASNAALAGLMQPYNVGKFNITVGLGGYRSATAIAAGAGYRFSNSAAVKAGIATNTANFDDLSYNVSTAFEF